MRIGIDCRKIADFGIGTYIRGLLRGLAGLDSGDDWVAFVPALGSDLIPKNFERVIVNTPNYSLRELFTMRFAIDASRLDLFHSPHFVLPLTPCPAITTLHDVILFRFPPKNPIGGLYVRGMTRRAANKSIRVLTVSNAAKADLVSVVGCDPARIIVTPNGVDERFFGPHPATATGRYFLFVGNDKPHKNVDRLADAFEIVRKSDRTIELVLAGGGFERFASHDGIRAEGFVSDERLAALYRGALALVIPSLDEGFGLPALEAMACGTAVVTSNAPALLEVTGGAALHVDALSVDAIAAAMLRLSGDASLRRSLADRGTERARPFTWRRSAEVTLQAYHDAVRV